MVKDPLVILHAYVDFSEQLISSVKLSLSAPEKIMKILEQPFSHVRLFAEYPKLSFEEKNILFFVDRLQKETKKKQPLLTPPYSVEFLVLLFSAPVQIFLPDGTDFRLFQLNKSYTPKLFLSISNFSLSFQSKENSFIFLSQSFPLILSKRQIIPLQTPLPISNLEELYRKRNIALSDEEFLFYLQNAPIFSKFIATPNLVETDDIKPVFEFHYHNEKYELHIALEANIDGKKRHFNLPLKYARDKIAQNAPILLGHALNIILHIPSNHPARKKIDDIVSKCFQHFYALLGEIIDNKIITGDRANLFEHFLPSVSEGTEIYRSGKERKKLKFVLAEGKPALSIKGDSLLNSIDASDWLSVNFEYNHQSIRLTLKDLEEIIRQGFIERNGTLISLPEEELSPLEKLLNMNRKKSGEENLKVQNFFLPWLLSIYPKTNIPEQWKPLKDFVQEGIVPEISLPKHISDILRDYQKTGVKRLSLLHRFGFGAVLADEMGLGKTIQVLGFLDIHQNEGKTLIVTPSALIYNWLAEIEKFYPHRFKTLVINGNKAERQKKLENISQYDIILTSYHMLGSDIEIYKDYKFQFFIIDEAHHIKNKKAKRSKSVKSVNAKTKIAVSGTPLENNIGELWSVFDFVMPGFLGSAKNFQEEYEEPLRQFDSEKRKEALQHLRSMSAPFIIRRTKATVSKELPPKIEQTILTELTEKQKTLYLETLSRVRNHYFSLMEEKSFGQTRIDFLSALTKLRQIALHPSLVYPELKSEDPEELSSKMSALRELLDEAFDSNHRVLIFSQFVSMLALIREDLDKDAVPYFYIDGKTQGRVDLADEFNKSNVPVFLISLKAGGVGLNLTGADTVILFDPWWNPALENQAIDRTHRIGQNKTVNVYRLMTKGTIEEKIYNLQLKKNFVFESLMQEDTNFGAFSKDDLLSLLSDDSL